MSGDSDGGGYCAAQSVSWENLSGEREKAAVSGICFLLSEKKYSILNH